MFGPTFYINLLSWNSVLACIREYAAYQGKGEQEYQQAEVVRMKIEIFMEPSCGGENGLYSSELALHKRHVGSTEMTIWRYSLFLRPKSVLYWAAKACKMFTIPHKLAIYFLIICVHRSIASPGQSEQRQCGISNSMYCKLCCTQTLHRMCTFSIHYLYHLLVDMLHNSMYCY